MQLVLVLHNIRSAHNVGAILRTAEGFGVERVIFSGYTPHPPVPNDPRLPHIREKLLKQIAKTALGAQTQIAYEYSKLAEVVLANYKAQGYTLAALEQTPQAVLLPHYSPPKKLVLLLGEEVNGVAPELLKLCDVHLEIPMLGRKESFNVSVAAGIALYALTY